MSTPVIIGIGTIAAALAGRTLIRRGIIGGAGAAEQWVRGGFRAKMDRKEAIAILGLKCVSFTLSISCTHVLLFLVEMAQHYAPNSKMHTVKSCWQTTLTAEVHHTWPVKSTKRKISLRRQKVGAGSDL
jgi:hypothetical protein